MTQKLIIGTLAILIIGVIGSGIYFALPGDSADATEIVSNPQVTRQEQGGQGTQAQTGFLLIASGEDYLPLRLRLFLRVV